MKRMTLLTAVAALAITPAALAQEADIVDDPDGAYMSESPTRHGGPAVFVEDLPADAEVIKTESSEGYEPVSYDPKPDTPFVYNEDREIIATGLKPDETDGAYVQTASVIEVPNSDKLAQVYYAMDLNEDGVVARSEWADWQSDTAYAARFDEFNTDGDAILTLDEYRMSIASTYSAEQMTN